MEKSTAPNNSFDEAPDAEPVQGVPLAGDADAVEGTTYVVGRGADERAQHEPGTVQGGEADAPPANAPLPPRAADTGGP